MEITQIAEALAWMPVLHKGDGAGGDRGRTTGSGAATDEGRDPAPQQTGGCLDCESQIRVGIAGAVKKGDAEDEELSWQITQRFLDCELNDGFDSSIGKTPEIAAIPNVPHPKRERLKSNH